jgi:hypothetical protein
VVLDDADDAITNVRRCKGKSVGTAQIVDPIREDRSGPMAVFTGGDRGLRLPFGISRTQCFASGAKYDRVSITPQFLYTAIPVASGVVFLGRLRCRGR